MTTWIDSCPACRRGSHEECGGLVVEQHAEYRIWSSWLCPCLFGGHK